MRSRRADTSTLRNQSRTPSVTTGTRINAVFHAMLPREGAIAVVVDPAFILKASQVEYEVLSERGASLHRFLTAPRIVKATPGRISFQNLREIISTRKSRTLFIIS